MNSFYMDYVGMQDGIPEYGQSAFILAVDGNDLILSEPVSGDGSMVIRIRNRDGTAMRPMNIISSSGNRITLEEIPAGVTTDPNNPTVVYIGRLIQYIREGIISEVTPSADGTVDFQALNYDVRVYADDDSAPDRAILTSHPYRKIILTSAPYRSITLTSHPYLLGFFDNARSRYSLSVERTEPPRVDQIESVGISEINATIILRDVVQEYTAPIESVGISEINATIILKDVVQEYTAPIESVGISEINATITLKDVVQETRNTRDSAASGYTIEVERE